jgi:hypothetical protein
MFAAAEVRGHKPSWPRAVALSSHEGWIQTLVVYELAGAEVHVLLDRVDSA